MSVARSSPFPGSPSQKGPGNVLKDIYTHGISPVPTFPQSLQRDSNAFLHAFLRKHQLYCLHLKKLKSKGLAGFYNAVYHAQDPNLVSPENPPKISSILLRTIIGGFDTLYRILNDDESDNTDLLFKNVELLLMSLIYEEILLGYSFWRSMFSEIMNVDQWTEKGITKSQVKTCVNLMKNAVKKSVYEIKYDETLSKDYWQSGKETPLLEKNVLSFLKDSEKEIANALYPYSIHLLALSVHFKKRITILAPDILLNPVFSLNKDAYLREQSTVQKKTVVRRYDFRFSANQLSGVKKEVFLKAIKDLENNIRTDLEQQKRIGKFYFFDEESVRLPISREIATGHSSNRDNADLCLALIPGVIDRIVKTDVTLKNLEVCPVFQTENVRSVPGDGVVFEKFKLEDTNRFKLDFLLDASDTEMYPKTMGYKEMPLYPTSLHFKRRQGVPYISESKNAVVLPPDSSIGFLNDSLLNKYGVMAVERDKIWFNLVNFILPNTEIQNVITAENIKKIRSQFYQGVQKLTRVLEDPKTPEEKKAPIRSLFLQLLATEDYFSTQIFQSNPKQISLFLSLLTSVLSEVNGLPLFVIDLYVISGVNRSKLRRIGRGVPDPGFWGVNYVKTKTELSNTTVHKFSFMSFLAVPVKSSSVSSVNVSAFFSLLPPKTPSSEVLLENGVPLTLDVDIKSYLPDFGQQAEDFVNDDMVFITTKMDRDNDLKITKNVSILNSPIVIYTHAMLNNYKWISQLGLNNENKPFIEQKVYRKKIMDPVLEMQNFMKRVAGAALEEVKNENSKPFIMSMIYKAVEIFSDALNETEAFVNQKKPMKIDMKRSDFMEKALEKIDGFFSEDMETKLVGPSFGEFMMRMVRLGFILTEDSVWNLFPVHVKQYRPVKINSIRGFSEMSPFQAVKDGLQVSILDKRELTMVFVEGVPFRPIPVEEFDKLRTQYPVRISHDDSLLDTNDTKSVEEMAKRDSVIGISSDKSQNAEDDQEGIPSSSDDDDSSFYAVTYDIDDVDEEPLSESETSPPVAQPSKRRRIIPEPVSVSVDTELNSSDMENIGFVVGRETAKSTLEDEQNSKRRRRDSPPRVNEKAEMDEDLSDDYLTQSMSDSSLLGDLNFSDDNLNVSDDILDSINEKSQKDDLFAEVSKRSKNWKTNEFTEKIRFFLSDYYEIQDTNAYDVNYIFNATFSPAFEEELFYMAKQNESENDGERFEISKKMLLSFRVAPQNILKASFKDPEVCFFPPEVCFSLPNSVVRVLDLRTLSLSQQIKQRKYDKDVNYYYEKNKKGEIEKIGSNMDSKDKTEDAHEELITPGVDNYVACGGRLFPVSDILLVFVAYTIGWRGVKLDASDLHNFLKVERNTEGPKFDYNDRAPMTNSLSAEEREINSRRLIWVGSYRQMRNLILYKPKENQKKKQDEAAESEQKKRKTASQPPFGTDKEKKEALDDLCYAYWSHIKMIMHYLYTRFTNDNIRDAQCEDFNYKDQPPTIDDMKKYNNLEVKQMQKTPSITMYQIWTHYQAMYAKEEYEQERNENPENVAFNTQIRRAYRRFQSLPMLASHPQTSISIVENTPTVVCFKQTFFYYVNAHLCVEMKRKNSSDPNISYNTLKSADFIDNVKNLDEKGEELIRNMLNNMVQIACMPRPIWAQTGSCAEYYAPCVSSVEYSALRAVIEDHGVGLDFSFAQKFNDPQFLLPHTGSNAPKIEIKRNLRDNIKKLCSEGISMNNEQIRIMRKFPDNSDIPKSIILIKDFILQLHKQMEAILLTSLSRPPVLVDTQYQIAHTGNMLKTFGLYTSKTVKANPHTEIITHYTGCVRYIPVLYKMEKDEKEKLLNEIPEEELDDQFAYRTNYYLGDNSRTSEVNIRGKLNLEKVRQALMDLFYDRDTRITNKSKQDFIALRVKDHKMQVDALMENLDEYYFGVLYYDAMLLGNECRFFNTSFELPQRLQSSLKKNPPLIKFFDTFSSNCIMEDPKLKELYPDTQLADRSYLEIEKKEQREEKKRQEKGEEVIPQRQLLKDNKNEVLKSIENEKLKISIQFLNAIGVLPRSRYLEVDLFRKGLITEFTSDQNIVTVLPLNPELTDEEEKQIEQFKERRTRKEQDGYIEFDPRKEYWDLIDPEYTELILKQVTVRNLRNIPEKSELTFYYGPEYGDFDPESFVPPNHGYENV